MKNRSADGGLVYSTDSGRMCSGCRQPIASCQCVASSSLKTGDGIVRVSRETQGRKGKGVTVIRGLPMESAVLEKTARELKAACGSGGTVKDGAVEIQGDHRDRIVLFLQTAGFTVKRAGG
jgi:translation initiation factor 1